MTNLEQTVQRIANGCLVYAVDIQTGELLPMTQDEFAHARKRKFDWVPYTDPTMAVVHSTLIQAALRRWEMAS